MGFSVGYIPPGDHGRVCDVCARLRPGRSFRKVGNVYVCDFHPSYVTRQQLEKAPVFHVKGPEAIKDGKPWAPRDTFEASETAIFNFVTHEATLGLDSYGLTSASLPVTGASTLVASVAWTAIYLYEMIVEAGRTVRWITLARARLLACAEWLLANQAGGPAKSTYTNSALEWGGYLRSGAFDSGDSGEAGLALLRAYQLLGDTRYVAGARACAWFLRSAQCGDLLSSFPSSSDSAGSSVKHYGMWTSTITASPNYYFDHRYAASNLAGLEFLHLFKTLVGDETIGSSSVTAPFNASRAALVSVAIAEAKAFWTTPQWSVDDNAAISGLSTTTPRQDFDSYPALKGAVSGRGSWRLISVTDVSGSTIAMGIRAFRAVDGDTTFVTGLFDWLTSTTANASFELPARTTGRMVTGYDDRVVWAGKSGAFDARIAPAHSINAATNKAGNSFYDISAVGLIAALYSNRHRAYFKALKEALAVPRPRAKGGSDADGQKYVYPALIGRCGYSFQPYSGETGRFASAGLASRVGLIYRQEPKAFMGRGLV